MCKPYSYKSRWDGIYGNFIWKLSGGAYNMVQLLEGDLVETRDAFKLKE